MKIYTMPVGVCSELALSHWKADGEDFVLLRGDTGNLKADEAATDEMARIKVSDIENIVAGAADHARWVLVPEVSGQTAYWRNIYAATLAERVSVRDYFARSGGAHTVAQLFIPTKQSEPILVLCGRTVDAFVELSNATSLDESQWSVVMDQMPTLAVEQVDQSNGVTTLRATLKHKDGSVWNADDVEIFWESTGGFFSLARTKTGNGFSETAFSKVGNESVRVKVGFKHYAGVAECIIA
jgi:hypothetical protein